MVNLFILSAFGQWTPPTDYSVSLTTYLQHPNANTGSTRCNLNAAPAATKLTDINPAFRTGVTVFIDSKGDYTTNPNYPESWREFTFAITTGLKSIVCSNPIVPDVIQCDGVGVSFNWQTHEHLGGYVNIKSDNDYVYVTSSDCTNPIDSDNNFKVFFTVYRLEEVIKDINILQDGIVFYPWNSPNFVSTQLIKLGKPATLVVKLVPNMDITGSTFTFYGKKLITTQRNSGATGEVQFAIDKYPYYGGDRNLSIDLRGDTTNGNNVYVGYKTVFFNTDNNYPRIDSADIYQVIKNPILFSPSTTVDLVAGKNADIILKTVPNFDVTGSVIEWTNKNGVIKNYFPKSNTSDSSGNVVFEIDPVPATDDFVGAGTSMLISLKSIDFAGAPLYLQAVQKNVFVRKTKPIRIGFVPISGCLKGANQCFTGVTQQEAQTFRDHAMEIFRAWYPVDNDVISRSIVYPADAMAATAYQLDAKGKNIFSVQNVDLDLANLRGFKKNQYDHIIGLIDESYFDVFNSLYGGYKGIATFPQGILRNDMPAIVAKDYYYALAHEIGHSYDLHHSAYSSSGLSNYDLDTRWNFLRGLFLIDKKSVMTAGPDLKKIADAKFFTELFWMYDQDYLELFRNLSGQSISSPTKFFNLTTQRNDYFNFFKFLNIFEKKGSDLNNKKSKFLNYSFNLLDKNKNQIYSGNATEYETIAELQDANSTDLVPSGKLLDFEIPNLTNSVYINLAEVAKNNQQNEFFVLNTLLLQQKLNLIDDGAILSQDKSKIKSQLQGYINLYDQKMRLQLFDEAEKIVNNQIYPFLVNNLTDSYVPKTATTIGKNAFVQTAITASINSRNLVNQNDIVSNGFINLKEIYKDNLTTKIKLKVLTKPDNPNLEIAFKVWLNSEEIKQFQSQVSGEYFIEGNLLSGQNQWVVKTYLVDTKVNRQTLGLINQLYKDKNELQKKYDDSVSLSEKEILNQQILFVSKRVDQAKNIQFENMTEFGHLIQKSILN